MLIPAAAGAVTTHVSAVVHHMRASHMMTITAIATSVFLTETGVWVDLTGLKLKIDTCLI